MPYLPFGTADCAKNQMHKDESVFEKYKYIQYKNIKKAYRHSMLFSSTIACNASFIHTTSTYFFFANILALKCISRNEKQMDGEFFLTVFVARVNH